MGRKDSTLTATPSVDGDALKRIEAKLDAILGALADEPEDMGAVSLDEQGDAPRPATL